MNKTQKGISTNINNSKNLNLIINSDVYKLAYEDNGLLNRSEMRGAVTAAIKLIFGKF